MRRRGFLMVEFLVAAAVLGVLTVSTYHLLADQFRAGVDVAERGRLDRKAREIADALGRHSTGTLGRWMPSPRWFELRHLSSHGDDEVMLRGLADRVEEDGVEVRVAFRTLGGDPEVFELHVRVRTPRRLGRVTLVRRLVADSQPLDSFGPPTKGIQERLEQVQGKDGWGQASSWGLPTTLEQREDLARSGLLERLDGQVETPEDFSEAPSRQRTLRSRVEEAAWASLTGDPGTEAADGRPVEVVDGVRYVGGVAAGRGIAGPDGILARGVPEQAPPRRASRARAAARFLARTGVSGTRPQLHAGDEVPDGTFDYRLEAYDGRPANGQGAIVGAYLLTPVDAEGHFVLTAQEKRLNGHVTAERLEGDEVLAATSCVDGDDAPWLVQRTEERLFAVQLTPSGLGRMVIESLHAFDGGYAPTNLTERQHREFLARLELAPRGDLGVPTHLLRAADYTGPGGGALKRIRCAGGGCD